MPVDGSTLADPDETQGLHRVIRWPPAFWRASGMPACVLFSIERIAATICNPSWIMWMLSVGFGFIQAFIYAEIAGLFPPKNSGASVYSMAAMVKRNVV